MLSPFVTAQAVQVAPLPKDGTDQEKSNPSHDVDMEGQESADQPMLSPERRRSSTEDYTMGDPLTKAEQEEKEEEDAAEPGPNVPVLNVQDATPIEPPGPPPPLGMDREQ